eukprot:gene17301-biopygen10661
MYVYRMAIRGDSHPWGLGWPYDAPTDGHTRPPRMAIRGGLVWPSVGASYGHPWGPRVAIRGGLVWPSVGASCSHPWGPRMAIHGERGDGSCGMFAQLFKFLNSNSVAEAALHDGRLVVTAGSIPSQRFLDPESKKSGFFNSPLITSRARLDIYMHMPAPCGAIVGPFAGMPPMWDADDAAARRPLAFEVSVRG